MYADPLVFRHATKAAVLALPEASFGPIGEGTLHALVHLFRVTLPAFVWCREEDLLIVRVARFGATETPAIVFVDAHPGGVGFSEAVTLDVLRVVCGFSLAIVERCPSRCAAPDGCPSCLQIPQCHAAPGEESKLDKRGVRELLGKILGRS
nr:Zn-binding domain-containing protein [Polyangium spumosum]